MKETKHYIYADAASTTPILPEVMESMMPYFKEYYANPSSLSKRSQILRKIISDSREQIALCIGAFPEEIYFTSGGTESDNWALKGCAIFAPPQKRTVVTSKIEHHAVLKSCETLQKIGISVRFLPVDKMGKIRPLSAKKLIDENTQLVSVMMANNEVGTLEPIQEIAEIAHAEGAYFHSDAVQAVGHIPIDVHRLGVDMLSASAHKFNGPKGIGFLFLKKGVPICNLIDGGQQENGYRAGTENIALIVGMATALMQNCKMMKSIEKKLTTIENKFKKIIKDNITDVIFNGNPEHHLPGFISLSFPGILGESMVHLLDINGVAVSTGAACNSKNTDISHVLKAIRLSKKKALGTLRVSFSRINTINDAEIVAKKIVQVYNKIS